MALAVPSLIWAVPADPRVRTLKNPDGTSVEVRVHGDEHFHFMTDAACTAIMHQNEAGYYVNTVRDGAPLVFNRRNVEMLRAEKEAASPNFALAPAAGPSKMASLDAGGRSNYPTIGNGTRSLVVLVEFDDVDFTVENPKEYFTRQLNEPGFSDYGGKGSALDYFKDASHGLYTPQFDVYGPVKVSKKASYFKDTNSGRMGLLISEAVTQLCESGELDLSNYDFDEDGILDTIFIYYAGYGSADSKTETIWPHQSDYSYLTYYGYPVLKYNGVKVGPYACANELKGWNPQTGRQPWDDGSTPWVDGIGTFVHEYGHVLGLPDMYDVDYNDETVTPGDWDVMDGGCYNFQGCVPPLYSAYEQWVCRWLEYTDAVDGTHYDLKALGNSETPAAVRLRIPKTTSGTSFESEYFVMEARDNSKWDACFPEPGLMIWRINYKKNLWTSNSVNSKNGSNVEILYADGEEEPMFTGGHVYPGSVNELIPSKIYGQWKSPFITDISYDADAKQASFDFNVITEAPKGAPVLNDQPYADKGTARNFTLSWNEVEGAETYLLTIKRVSTGKVLGLYDEFDVGNVTSQKVVSVPLGYWNNEIEAYVRAVKGIPCADTSNVVRFVPKDLPKGSDQGSVESVGSEVVISGGEGCVIAPEGAEVYDMAGQRLQKENLMPGVYIVAFGSKTVKVVVK